MKKFIVFLSLLIMTMMLSSCNMLRGAGEDIGIAGDAVRDATN